MIPQEVFAGLAQYGALGAIAMCSIYGVYWVIRGMRQDVHDMIQANQKGNKAFQDYLIEQSRALSEQSRQAAATNAGFVQAINMLTDRIDRIMNHIPSQRFTQSSATPKPEEH